MAALCEPSMIPAGMQSMEVSVDEDSNIDAEPLVRAAQQLLRFERLWNG